MTALLALLIVAPPALVPWPKSLVVETGALPFSRTPTIVTKDPALAPLRGVLLGELGRAYPKATQTNGTVRLSLNPKLEPERYRLTVGKEVAIEGGSYGAVAMGTATLLQSLSESPKGLSLPKLRIDDQPSSDYRGLLVDVARRFHSIANLKQCVDLCRLYKIRYLQLHLTDDQAFTFPSTAFPTLQQANNPGNPGYTLAELKDLVAYADARAVTIIPEIDMPGHSATLNRALPDLFKLKGTRPYEHHATINFANDDVIKAVETLVGEVCDVFRSSPYFHMGGDEADYALADQHPDFQAAFKRLGLPDKSQHQLYRRFIGLVNEMAKRRGKKLIVWEGFGREPDSPFPIPKDVLVMEFENAYYAPTDLLADGYQLVNASWTPLYVVNQHVWQAKKVYDWDLTKFGRFSTLWATTGWYEAPSTTGIVGAQVCSWEQPEYLEIQNLRRVIPAMAERVWNPARRPFEDFSTRLTATDALLGRLVSPVEIKAQGLAALGPDDFDNATFSAPATLTLSARSDGILRFTLDGTPPSAASAEYKAPVEVKDTATLRAALFAPDGRQRGSEAAMTLIYVPPKRPSLATGKKVTCSGGTQGPQAPELAVDDNLDLGSSWWAGPAPQWLQVDLGAVETVGSIEVFPYWDGSRYYQYTVETSADGKTWAMALDRRTNTTPASSSGEKAALPPTKCRYVRVTMLKGSANDSVHLVELRVWPPKP